MLRQGGIRILHATGRRSNGTIATSHAIVRSLSPHTSTFSLHEQHQCQHQHHHQYHSLSSSSPSSSPSHCSSPLHTNTVRTAVHNNGSAHRSAVLSRRWKSNLHKRAARALGKSMKDRKPEDVGDSSLPSALSSAEEKSGSGIVSEMGKNAPSVASHDDEHAKPPPSFPDENITDAGGTEMAGEVPLPPPIGHLNEFAPKIVVVGVGGGGGNAVNNMIASQLHGVDFLTLNTDAQHLSTTLTTNRIQIGSTLTSGLGCGANPEAGRLAAEESRSQITDLLSDAHMVFICAGMGGGTGTGAAPVVAELCYEMGILTVGVVTKPFRFEGTQRMRLAEEGITRLRSVVDTLIVIPNQNLFHMADEGTSFVDSFAMADNVLLAGVKSITDLMTTPGLINLDFADVQSVMSGMGNAILGTGQSSFDDIQNSAAAANGANGKNKQSASVGRAVAAAEMALANPLLGSNMDIGTAKGMLVNITGGKDMTLFEVDRAAQLITERVEDDHANIIFGSAYDETLEGSVRVSVVATGIEEFVEEK